MLNEKNKNGTKACYEDELKRLDKSGLPPDVIAKVKEFLSYAEISENLKYDRLKFHANNLRMIFQGMVEIGSNDRIINPSAQDVIDALAKQKSRKTKKKNGEEPISDWYFEGFKTSIKKFYKWLGFPETVKTIKYNKNPTKRHKPDYIITQEQVDLLVTACDNARDKAIISLLYDSGVRIGELLKLKIGDVEFDEYGMKIKVTGQDSKTKGHQRAVRIMGDSIGYVRSWINVHPSPLDLDAWLFCGIGHDFRGKTAIGDQLNHSNVYSALRRIQNRAIKLGFPPNKELYPHKFRHNYATKLVTMVPETILEKQLGWIFGSKMTGVYVHLNDEMQDNTILTAYGIKKIKTEKEMRQSKTCLRCKTINPSKNAYCLQCGMPLDTEETGRLIERVDLLADKLKSSDLINTNDKLRIERKIGDTDSLIDQLLDNLRELKDEGKLDQLRSLLFENGKTSK